MDRAPEEVLHEAILVLSTLETTIASFQRTETRGALEELSHFVAGFQQLDFDLSAAEKRLRRHLPDPDKTPVEPLTRRRLTPPPGASSQTALVDALDSLRRLRRLIEPVDRAAALRLLELLTEITDGLTQVGLDMRMAGYRLKTFVGEGASEAGRMTPLRPPSGQFPGAKKP